MAPSKNEYYVGEAFVGKGANIAHLDVIIGSKSTIGKNSKLNNYLITEDNSNI